MDGSLICFLSDWQLFPNLILSLSIWEEVSYTKLQYAFVLFLEWVFYSSIPSALNQYAISLLCA